MAVSNAGGRATAGSLQGSHTIPQELFTGAKRPQIIDLFQQLDAAAAAAGLPRAQLNLDSPDNLQPLPADAITQGSAPHNGSHPGMTRAVRLQLDRDMVDLHARFGDDIENFLDGVRDPEVITRLLNETEGTLREEIAEFQFKSTNFMDAADDVGNRMIFNDRDIDYLRQTDVWDELSDVQQTRAEADLTYRTQLIEEHNLRVAEADLSPAQQREMKVLVDLGDGSLAHMDGGPLSRDSLRALIREADILGVDLMEVDARVFIEAIEDVRNTPAIQELTRQIDELETQIREASDDQRSRLLREQAVLEGERTNLRAAQTIGDMPANDARRGLLNAITSRPGRALSEVSKVVFRKMLVAVTPVANVLDVVSTIADVVQGAHELGMRYSPTYRDKFADWYRITTGNEFDATGYIRTEDMEVVVHQLDWSLTITAKRIDDSGPWEVFKVTVAEGINVLKWTLDYLMGKKGGEGAGTIKLLGGGSRLSAAFIERDANGDQVFTALDETQVGDDGLAVQQSTTITLDESGQEIERQEEVTAVQRDEETGRATQVPLDFATVGSIFGSQLAGLLNISNPLAKLAAGAVLGTIGLNIGQALDNGLDDFFEEFGAELGQAARGAVSSYLLGELVEEFGVEGEAAAVITQAGGAAITQIATNLSRIPAGQTSVVIDGQTVTWSSGVNVALANAAGAYFGAWLASELVQFDTVSGQIGAAVGSAIGAAAGIKMGFEIGGQIGGFYGAIIGAFVGFIFGGLLGSLFGETPKSAAGIGWNEYSQRFIATWTWTKGGASADSARSVAAGVAEVLNSVVEATGSRVVDSGNIRLGSYGTHDKNFVYRTVNAHGRTIMAFKAQEVDRVMNYGLAISIADMIPRLAGGNVFVKRALAATFELANIDPNAIPVDDVGRVNSVPAMQVADAFDVSALMGNLRTAMEFTSFLQQADTIKALMNQEPDSAFSAMWVVTLARAWELGLHKRAATDWTGGWTMFMDEADGGTADGQAFSPALLEFGFNATTRERLIGFVKPDGSPLDVLGDTIDTASKDRILGTDANDIITVSGNELATTTGLTINGALSTGAAHVIDVAASIEGGLGDDTILAGDLGNDLIGGEGNDTLVGGKLDDWLFGEAGNDRLFAGAADYQFTEGNAVAAAAAIDVIGNGDLLDGGAGDDVLYGSRGSDWLRGGAGVDAIYGGAGGDIIDGGAGNDRGPNGEARLLGGGGTDQYIFGYGAGIDVVFDEADSSAAPGSTQDSLFTRLQFLNNGMLDRNWAGGGDYEADGSVRGGEDAIALGIGIDFEDVLLERSGTESAPGQDLIIRLTMIHPTSQERVLTGDQLVIKDWFESTRRVEWLRFADGQEIRIGDLTSMVVGTSGADVIIGTYGADFIVGGAGPDTIRGLHGADFGFGGKGRDLVAGDEDNDLVSGGDDEDKVIGGQGQDTVFGDGGDDDVYGGDGFDIVVGGRGNDQVAGGTGNDIFRYQRGDGSDVLLDAYVDNWELVWHNGSYTNGYVLNAQTNTVAKNGVTVFDGSQWIGLYDYADATSTLQRHLGAVNGRIAGNSGVDYLEFGVGIDIQDLLLSRVGADLQIAISTGDGDARQFASFTDRITIRDWYLTGTSIENVVFAATGRHDISSWSIAGAGTDGADTINGTGGVDWITGNAGDDTISGGAGDDILSGNTGTDIIRGGDGADVIYGGDGDDLLEGGIGADHLIGGTGVDIASYSTSATAVSAYLSATHTGSAPGNADRFVSIEGLEGSNHADRLGGDSGSNILRGLGGNDALYGGAGADSYEVGLSHGHDTIVDAPFQIQEIVNAAGVFNPAGYTANWSYIGEIQFGADILYCYQLVVTNTASGEEVYRSRDMVDFIYFASPSQPLPAAAGWPTANGQWRGGVETTGNGYQAIRQVFSSEDGGADVLELGSGVSLSDLTFERLNGGADLRIGYSANDSITILGQGNVNRAIETLQLGDGLSADLTRLVLVGESAGAQDDLLVGNAAANTLSGLDGNDVISGGGGNDSLLGGAGDDVLEGGAGGDTLDGGTDSLTAGQPVTADQALYGDTIRYVRSSDGVNIDLAARTASGGHAAGDIIVAVGGVSTIENVVGSDGYDVLLGDARANRLSGLGANDVIEGRGGNDVLSGGSGDDTLRGGDGDDNVAGDSGVDWLEGGNGEDLLAGGDGGDYLYGDAGEDQLSGGAGNDRLHGGSEDDRLGGDAGADLLYGDEGADHLAGGEGNDSIYAGDGNDVLAGELGDDVLSGEAGDDTYLFDAASGSDLIVDLAGMNRIAISGVASEQVWITRWGNDLRIAVIGGTTTITLQNYFAAGATQVREIALADRSLFLAHAAPLINQMTSVSAGTTPATMPQSIVDAIAPYWHAVGRAAPVVVDQTYSTDDLTVVSGAVGAVDHDDNIVAYELVQAAGWGIVSLNAATGSWTYTPNGEYNGADSFSITVRDADGNVARQIIAVNVTATERALPPIIQIAQAAEPEAPLLKPTLDSGYWIVHIQGQLADTDRSEALDVRVSNVPEELTFDTGTYLGGGVWSFGAGPWPTRLIGPANWSQDLSLVISASSREIGNGRIAHAEPVTLAIEINARPTEIIADRSLSLEENTAAGTVLAQLSATDADASDTATYSLVSDAGGRFTLDSDGTLRAGGSATNYEGATSHVVRVRVTDSGGLSYERDFNVGVLNVNEAPAVANQSYNAAEDTVVNGAVAAQDPDGNIASYSLVANGSHGVVSLNGATGTWQYTANPNYHGADTFQVRVTDANGLSAVQLVTVNLSSVNDAPSSIALTGGALEIAENDRPISGTVGTPVVLGTLSAIDVDAPDSGDFASLVFTVSDARFEIVDGNVLRLRAGAVIDFETTSSIELQVTVTDRNGTTVDQHGGPLSYTRTFVFAILDRDDYFYGTEDQDEIEGTAGRNIMYGLGGVDLLVGAGADDVMDGGDGNDSMYGGTGNDVMIGGLGEDTLFGEDGDDTLSGGDGTDFLVGAEGNDTLIGGEGDDFLIGFWGDDQSDGGAGDDVIIDEEGNDRLVGGAGNDYMIGGEGADHYLGGDGDEDTVSYESAREGIVLDVTTTVGSAGHAEGDVFEDSIEIILGSAFSDTITGGAGNEFIFGGEGDGADVINGGGGNDRLEGGDGDDTLNGGAGDDLLNGGAGSDLLNGGDGSDTYLMDVTSGADEIRNFDPNGTDIDVVGYQGITSDQLWFERIGNDLVVTVVGTSVRTTVKDWYVIASANERANYKIDFFLASGRVTETIDAEALVELMEPYTPPATQEEFDDLHEDPDFEQEWSEHWNTNAPPLVPAIAAQTLAEDGSLSLSLTITDDATPANGITVTVEAVRTDNYDVEDLSIVNAPTISAADANGLRTLTVNALPDASGQVAIKVTAIDAGGVTTVRVFLLTVNAVADTPVLTVVQAVTPVVPLTQPTLDGGSWALDIQAALTDQDGSETLEIQIANVPAGITFNAGTNLGGGVWSFTPAQLTGLSIQGPSTWSQDLALSVTAISRETATGQTATSAAVPLNIVINARPTDLVAATALSFAENQPSGTALTTFTRSDADAGDTASYSLVNDAGGRFTIDSNGTLRAGLTPLDFESATSHVIRVRVTDSGGLTYEEDFTVAVTNANEAPTDIAADRTLAFAENLATGSSLAWFSRTDADAGDTATYSIVPGQDAGGRYTLRSDGLLMVGSVPANYEQASSHTIRVRVTDAGGLTREEDFTIGVLNVNDAPNDIIPDRTLAFNEDIGPNTELAWLTSTDDDAGDTATFSIVPGQDAGGRFTVGSDGRLRTGSTPLNYEAASSHTIRVRVTDAGGAFYEEDITIAVLNRNEAPTDLQFDRSPIFAESVNGSVPTGTGLAWILRTDADANDTASYAIVPGFDAGGRFAVRSDGLLYAATVPLDYETGHSFTIRVQVIDSGGLSYIEDMTVGLSNVSEAPTNIYADRALSFSENITGGVAWIRADDPELNVSNFSLLDNAGGRFIVSGDGLLSIVSPLNYEAATGHWITVRATDTSGLYRDQSLWVSVQNVNEAPAISPASFTVREGNNGGPGNLLVTTGGSLALVSGSDPEGVALSYQVVAGDTSMFTIRSDGYLIQHGSLDYETDASYNVLVRAWDGGSVGAGNHVDSWVPITVANVNEGPRVVEVTTHVEMWWEGEIQSWVPHYYYGFRMADPEGNAVVATDSLVMGDLAGTSTIEQAWTGGNPWPINWDIWNSQPVAMTLTVNAQDSNGAWATTLIHFGADYSITILPPVVLDLDGDGLELISLEQSSVAFDMNSNGGAERTGWVGADDGLLVLDRNADGTINNGSEISYIQDLPGANSDLEGLTAFDSNVNGLLDAGDVRYGEFLIWQDVNQDGVSQAGELRSLADHGIAAISLTRTPTGQSVEGARDNVTLATSEFIRTDGSIGAVGDVMLAYQSLDGTARIIGQDDAVDGVDRSSDAPPTDVTFPRSSRPEPIARLQNPGDEMASQSPASDAPATGSGDEAEQPQDNAARRRSAIDDTAAAEIGDDADTFATPAQQSALHASLSTIARRRLQMVEAMSSFAEDEGAADLSLRPQRHVDSRVLELLTSVPPIKVA